MPRLCNTKERRQLRETFVREHADKIEQLLVDDQHTPLGDADGIHDFVTQVVRPGLSYDKNTSWQTIWYTLRQAYNNVYKTDF